MAAPGARAVVFLGLPLILAGLSACDSFEKNVALGAVGVTLLGAQAPTHEIEQIYYLGEHCHVNRIYCEIAVTRQWSPYAFSMA